MEQIPVSSSPVKRGENLTDEQRQYLIEKIEAYKDPLTDKRNDLQTIHRKKHTWEKITDDFNKKFSSLLRKRSIQQIQTWYKNEKARCRRVLIRQRLRQQNQAAANSRSFEVSFNDAPTLKLDSDSSHHANIINYSSNQVSVSRQHDSQHDDSTFNATPEYAQGDHHKAPEPPGRAPNFSQLSIPSLLALTSKSEVMDSDKMTNSDTQQTTTLLSFLRSQAHLSDDRPFIPLFPKEVLCLNNPDSMKSQNSLTLPNPELITPTAESKLNRLSSPTSEAESKHQSTEEESYEKLLFDRKMEVLSVKEECIRRYYDKKEDVLKVKEQYYKLKMQILRDQVLSAQSDLNFYAKGLTSLPVESIHGD